MAGVDADAKERCERQRPHALRAWRETGIMLMVVVFSLVRLACDGAQQVFCEPGESFFDTRVSVVSSCEMQLHRESSTMRVNHWNRTSMILIYSLLIM